MFLSLYTDKAKGILTEQRFMKLTAALEQEQESNQKRLHDLAVMQSRADAQESEVRTFIKEIRRYSAIEVLDEAVLNRLISKILSLTAYENVRNQLMPVKLWELMGTVLSC